jgi:4-alpha-glucanotransferase
LQFAVCEDDFSLESIGTNCVCYTGTHDNDTTVGWFQGSSNDNRDDDEIKDTQHRVLSLTGGSAETVHNDFIKAAFATEAYLAIAPMQDFLGLGSEARLNTPGTTGGNWRWRLQSEQLTPELFEEVEAMVVDAARAS